MEQSRLLKVGLLAGGSADGCVDRNGGVIIPTALMGSNRMRVRDEHSRVHLLIGRAAQGFDGLGGAVLSSKPLLFLGRISYGLYSFSMRVRFLGYQSGLPTVA